MGIYLKAVTALFACLFSGSALAKSLSEAEIRTKVDALITQMTVDEKVGQLTLFSTGLTHTGPTLTDENVVHEGIKTGKIGGLFNAFTTDFTIKMQKLAVENSRLKIPLIFGFDVVHGYRTIFPVPLGEAASWDLEAIQKSARIAAIESTAAGLHWTYAPMVDVTRDPRWGRVIEGAGEDPFLGSKIARARVLGFQGNAKANGTYATDEILACVKHYAGYGAVEAGREYAPVEGSETTLREVHLPPFKAAVDAGVGSVMAAFTDWDGIPATASHYLLTEVLREELGFRGFVVTDYTAIRELIAHRYAGNPSQAAQFAKQAGVDMDMESGLFATELPRLIKDGKVSMAELDESVRKVLTVKYALGLFENPFRYSDPARERTSILTLAHLDAARDVARKSIVLLKNGAPDGTHPVLPLSQKLRSIAVIGPLADDKLHVMGPWKGFGRPSDSENLLDTLKSRLATTQVRYAPGASFSDEENDPFTGTARFLVEEAVGLAEESDVVVAVLGETETMSGEAASRSRIGIPAHQQRLLRALVKTGKPVVLVLMNGRPLALEWENENVTAILETWFLGTKTGSAITDVLLGEYNPSGKLPITFPRSVGQVPIYYAHKSTGRPASGDGDKNRYVSKYLDVANSPLFPFGYGLSYTTFAYSGLEVAIDDKTPQFETLRVSATIRNSGAVSGREVAQLYVRDEVSSVAQPVKLLKGFQIVDLQPGESKVAHFEINRTDLGFYKRASGGKMNKVFEAGDFTVMVGSDARTLPLKKTITIAQ